MQITNDYFYTFLWKKPFNFIVESEEEMTKIPFFVAYYTHVYIYFH